MRTQLRLLWRLHRWEGIFVIGGALLLAAVMAIVAWQLAGSRDVVVACHEQPSASLSSACRSAIEWGNTLAATTGVLSALATVTPFAGGLLLGAPLVSREIEHRTAPLAWSLGPSRQRWLAWRTLPLLLLLLTVLLVLGQASELLLETAEEGELGFRQFGMFGPMLATRGLAVFGVGVVVGMSIGRVLPAILVTALAVAAMVIGMSIGRDLLMREEAVWTPMSDQQEVVHMVFDQGFQSDATGEVITWDEAYNKFPDAIDPMTGEGRPPGMTPVWRIVAPEAFGIYAARENGVLIGLFAAAVVAATSLVGHRRPT